jgi:antitoxin YobK
MKHYESARRLLHEGHGLEVDGPQPAPAELIRKAEQALGLTFPPSYRQFLLDFGTGGFGSLEVYGIVGEDFDKSSVPDGIWCTLDERKNSGLDRRYLLVQSGGDGTYVAIDSGQSDDAGECPLVRLSIDGKPSEHVGDSFGAWLLDELTWRMSPDLET